MPTQNSNNSSEETRYRRPRVIVVRFDLALRNRSRKFCDPRQLLLPLQKVFTAATRLVHALPRFISSKAEKFLQNLSVIHRTAYRATALRRTMSLLFWRPSSFASPAQPPSSL